MNEAIVLEGMQGFCALGSLDDSAGMLLDGRSGIVAGPCYDVPVATAPFPDRSLARLPSAAEAIRPFLAAVPADLSRALFVFCAAKGDLTALNEHDKSVSPLLDSQARLAATRLGLAPLMHCVVSNACASGALALDLASRHLRSMRFTAAVVFGFDVISKFVTRGFFALNALSRCGARPFDRARDGLTLGDCAAIAVLTLREPRAGDTVIAGTGSSNDANHRTGPSRTGEGLMKAAETALRRASITPRQIGAVKCHGTATSYNDAMEAKAIHGLFGGSAPPSFSVKGAIGHGSGAGSLLEVLLAARFLQVHTAPPTAGFEMLGVDEPLPISARRQSIVGNHILCLSAGFGGMNAAVVVERVPS